MAVECHSFKASPVARETVADLVLTFDREVPRFSDRTWEADSRAAYVADGDRVESALFEHLPGALYDQILRAMLSRKASLLVISHIKPQ